MNCECDKFHTDCSIYITWQYWLKPLDDTVLNYIVKLYSKYFCHKFTHLCSFNRSLRSHKKGPIWKFSTGLWTSQCCFMTKSLHDHPTTSIQTPQRILTRTSTPSAWCQICHIMQKALWRLIMPWFCKSPFPIFYPPSLFPLQLDYSTMLNLLCFVWRNVISFCQTQNTNMPLSFMFLFWEISDKLLINNFNSYLIWDFFFFRIAQWAQRRDQEQKRRSAQG